MVEFAVAIPFLLILLIGIIDLSRAFSAQFLLHSAVSHTVELAQMGSSVEDLDYLKTEAAAAAQVPESNVDIEGWVECDGIKKSYTASCDNGQELARFLQIAITADFKPTFGAKIFPGVNPDGTIELKVDQGLRLQ